MIDKVGLEVEGGWPGDRYLAPLDIPLIDDFSIDGRMMPHDFPMQSVHVGECVSEPIPISETDAWIDKYWPTESNNTCGYHIHLSFTRIKDYTLLTRKSFLYTLLAAVMKMGEEKNLGKKHYLWNRINGDNIFTTINFDAVKQITIRDKRVADRTRYGMLNCCWNLHKTLEFRAYPTFKFKTNAKAFTALYIEQVQRYLEQHYNDEITQSAKLLNSYGDMYIVR